MDHAQETAVWRAIGELEAEVQELDKDIAGLAAALTAPTKRPISPVRAFDYLAPLALVIGGSMLLGSALLSRTGQDQRRGYVEFTISCPKQHETVCRVIAAEAERLAIEKFSNRGEGNGAGG